MRLSWWDSKPHPIFNIVSIAFTLLLVLYTLVILGLIGLGIWKVWEIIH